MFHGHVVKYKCFIGHIDEGAQCLHMQFSPFCPNQNTALAEVQSGLDCGVCASVCFCRSVVINIRKKPRFNLLNT